MAQVGYLRIEMGRPNGSTPDHIPDRSARAIVSSLHALSVQPQSLTVSLVKFLARGAKLEGAETFRGCCHGWVGGTVTRPLDPPRNPHRAARAPLPRLLR